MERNPKAYIRLRGRSFDISCYLGNGRPRRTAGGAEYEALRRPNADAATVFTGNGLEAWDVPVLFDGWAEPGRRHDIGPRVDQVTALAFGQDRRPPPDFIASGPFAGSGGRYQMSLPEELDEPKPIVGEGGTLFRQALMLKLVEFNDPRAIQWKTSPNRKAGKVGIASAVPKSIRLPRPMSLMEVGAQVYGDAGAAEDIGRVNGIRDLRKKLAAGTRLTLPEHVANVGAAREV